MSDMNFSVDGKSMVVTGAANGIGRSIALGLAEAGARITAGDVDDAALERLRAHAKTRGLALQTVHCDVSSAFDVSNLMGVHTERWGELNAAFANAGIAGRMVPATEISLQDLHRVLSVNLDGAFLVTRAAIDVMLPQGHGSIVMTSSVWGERGFEAPILAYAASKGALSNMVRQFAVELAPVGIRVNGILPAGIRTSIADGFYDDAHAVAALAQRLPAKRIAEPDVVVGPAQFLASEASSWITGHLLPVDGGYLAM